MTSIKNVRFTQIPNQMCYTWLDEASRVLENYYMVKYGCFAKLHKIKSNILEEDSKKLHY